MQYFLITRLYINRRIYVHDFQYIPYGKEIHPEVLENWGITVPCTAGEIDLDALLL